MKNKGFTLIELMVSVSIIVVLIGMGAASMSQFYARDKIISAKSEVISVLKMARNYAVTMQFPAEYAENGWQLDAVEVVHDIPRQLSVVAATTKSISNSTLEKKGSPYFTTTIKDSEVTLSSVDSDVIFSVPEGKLLNRNGTPKDKDYVKTIFIGAAGVGETMVVKINAMGVISGQ